MKKIVSILLTIMIIINCISVEMVGWGQTNSEATESNIEEFIDEANDIIAEYDTDKDYTFSSASVDFQTCRLIVEQSQNFESLNSVAVADGYKDFHIVQFANEEDTQSAYEYYSKCPDVISVDTDSIVECCEYNPDNSNFSTYDVNNNMFAGVDTHIIEAKQYLLDNVKEFHEVYVGIIDSGINKEHEALKGRFAGGRDFVDEKDIDGSDDVYGHGTEVAGVVVDKTLPNVKLYSYRVINENGRSSTACVALAVQQAIIDGVDVINMSFDSGTSKLLLSALDDAYEKNITLVAAAGNSNEDLNRSLAVYPACLDNVIAVGSATPVWRKKNDYSNYGIKVECYTNGCVTTTNKDGGYSTAQGTSFAAPAVAGECANIKTLYPDEENEYILQRLLDGSDYGVYGDLYGMGCYIDMYNPLAMERPEVKHTVEPYATWVENEDGTKTVQLHCDDEEALIFYHIYPLSHNYQKETIKPTNLTMYTGEFVISRNSNISFYAKAKKKRDSNFLLALVRLGHTENGFYCDDDGQITSFLSSEYDGDPKNIVVPDTIDSITVTSIKDYYPGTRYDYGFRFFDLDLETIVLPDTITRIGYNAFKYNRNLTTVIAPGVTEIDYNAFKSCQKLKKVVFSKIKYIGEYAFWKTESLSEFPYFEEIEEIKKYAFDGSGLSGELVLPKCTKVDDYGFRSTKIETIYAPEVTALGTEAFRDIAPLREAILPKLAYIGIDVFRDTPSLKKAVIAPIKNEGEEYNIFWNSGLKELTVEIDFFIYYSFFGYGSTDYLHLLNCPDEVDLIGADCKRVEIEKTEWVDISCDSDMIISIPSSVKRIDNYFMHNGTVSDNFIVYGTEGTFAHNWCIENGVTFKNISQENAVMTPLPEKIVSENTTLKADVIGFNRTYQWYSNDVADNTTGTAIEGATEQEFTPADYPLSNYYYCVVTSTDEGYDPVEIVTGVTELGKPAVNELGGSIRITDAGLRFGFSFDKIQDTEAEEYGFVYSYSETTDLNINNAKRKVAKNLIDHGDYVTFNLVFTGLPKSAYDQIISARAYVKIDGQYYYSNVLQRSFTRVANAVLADDSIDQNTKDTINKLLAQEA